jgi:chromosome segregation ATPase
MPQSSHLIAAEALQNSELALKELNDRLQQLSTSRGILNETHSNATTALRKTEEQRAEVDGRLSDLWSGLPTAKQEFESDALAFRRAFERSATECGDIEKRIAELVGLIQQAEAAIRPLEQSVTDAGISASACMQRRSPRSQKVGKSICGNAVSCSTGVPRMLVEEELANRVAAAAKSLDDAANAKTDADRLLVACDVRMRNKNSGLWTCAQAELALATAVARTLDGRLFNANENRVAFAGARWSSGS